MTLETIILIVSVVSAHIVYIRVEYVKHILERKNIKEGKYVNLIDSISSLYVQNQAREGNDDKKQFFQTQFRHCLLYAPDEVVENGKAFLDAITKNKDSMNQEEIDKYLYNAYNAFFLSIRKDMVKKTKVKELTL
jgi:hypothetical protein